MVGIIDPFSERPQVLTVYFTLLRNSQIFQK